MNSYKYKKDSYELYINTEVIILRNYMHFCSLHFDSIFFFFAIS